MSDVKKRHKSAYIHKINHTEIPFCQHSLPPFQSLCIITGIMYSHVSEMIFCAFNRLIQSMQTALSEEIQLFINLCTNRNTILYQQIAIERNKSLQLTHKLAHTNTPGIEQTSRFIGCANFITASLLMNAAVPGASYPHKTAACQILTSLITKLAAFRPCRRVNSAHKQ